MRPAKPEDPAAVETTIARLMRGADYWIDIPWPSAAEPCRVRLLSRTERQLAFAAARARFRALEIETVDLDSREEFAAEQINQILTACMTDPRRPISGTRGLCMRLYADADACRDAMTDDDQAWLWDAYLALEREGNPSVEDGSITPEMIALVAEAQKKRAPKLLKGIAPSTLRTWLATLAGPLSTSSTGKSGSGDSPETGDSKP